jgi:hypothetical protein
MRKIKVKFPKPTQLIRKYRLILISILHSFFLLILGYVWLGMAYTFGDEAFLIKWTSIIKKEILHIDPKPSPTEILFINTSQSKVEIEIHTDPLSVNPQKIMVTNREQLSHLLDLMTPYKNEIKLIVLDLLFDLPTENDSLLQLQFNELGNKVIGASHMPNEETILKPVFDVPYALATYRSAAGMYFKYPVMYKGQKTLPTVIYEIISGNKIVKKRLFFRDGKNYSLKAPITDFKVRMNDFKLGNNLSESNFALHHLETLNEIGPLMAPNDLKELFAGKLIIIGDFENDVHRTTFGMMPGLLIIFNAYLTLANQDNIINLGWLILMIFGFSWISYRTLTGRGFNLLHLLKNRFKSGWIHFVLDSLDELFFLSVLTFLSYLFFNIHINILVLFIYLKLIEFALDIIKNKYNLKI